MVERASGKPIKASAVCAEYGISRRTFDKWRANGLLVFRMGEKLLYTTREALQQFAQPVEPMIGTAPQQPKQSSDAVDAERRVRERWAI